MSAKALLYCLTDNVRMAKIIRPIVTRFIFAMHEDSPGQQSQFQTSYALYMCVLHVVFFNSHIHHSHDQTYKYLDKCINTRHRTLHSAIDLTINLFHWIVKVDVLPFLVFAAVINHRLQSDLYYNVVISLQFNLQTFNDCSYIPGTCRGCWNA